MKTSMIAMKVSLGALGLWMAVGGLGACDKKTSSPPGEPASLSDRANEPAEEEEAVQAPDPYSAEAMPLVRADTPVQAPLDLTLENEAIGIPECDAFVHAMNGCYLPKVAPEGRIEILAAMKQDRFAWKEASQRNRDEVQKSCVRALQERTTILKQAGCLP